MKKFILGLFLILGAVSFAVPSFIEATKLQKAKSKNKIFFILT